MEGEVLHLYQELTMLCCDYNLSVHRGHCLGIERKISLRKISLTLTFLSLWVAHCGFVHEL